MAISASLRISLYISALALIILRVELTLSEEIVSSRSKDVGSRSGKYCTSIIRSTN